jgi:predicted unusual protein kinase regulating ubiquinone biosynthesis (AarF/ABC1/UbiB family)
MKKLKSLKTGIFKRNIAFAKLASKVGKDLYLSKKDDLDQKISETLLKRTSLLKSELGELKGSFLKAGQMLAMYSQDLLPKEFNDLLIDLQGQTSYLEWNSIKKQLDTIHLDELTIEEEAFAAASIGQVHIAKKDDTVFALKIQYKNIEKLIDTDLWMLKKLLSVFKIIPKSYDFTDVFDEVKNMLKKEMDYDQERINAIKFKELAGVHYIVPTIYEKYCTSKVLCMEYIQAKTVDSYLLKATEEQKISLANDFFLLFLKEIFDWKLLQSDAHAGNYFIKDDKWVLIDFGATKEIEDKLYENLVHALFMRDRDLMFETLSNNGAMNMKETDFDYFWNYCKLISEPLQDYEYDWERSEIVSTVLTKAKELQDKIKFNRLPHENIFIDRKISGVYFMMKKIGVKINLNKLYHKFKQGSKSSL